MSGFFESIASRKASAPLLAAWVISGPGAGTKALFMWGHEHYSTVTQDPDFPDHCAEEILGLSWGRDGILETGGSRVFLEQVSGRRRLVVCGAGHVALCLIRLAVMLNFEVIAIDDREAFAEKAKEAGARVICRPFADALDEIDGDMTTAFVIMTWEHTHDVECLRRILRKPHAYAGMMGSRSRTARIREQLIAEGFDTESVNEVHMPIGLKIGSRTPEEIAVSVAAELIQVMNGSDSGEIYPAGMIDELAGAGGTERQAAILAMIVQKDGEGPRRPGTKMLVRQDGSFLGTVGGGYAEAAVLKTAAEMFREGCRGSRLTRISMVKGAMYCGGEIEVFLLPM